MDIAKLRKDTINKFINSSITSGEALAEVSLLLEHYFNLSAKDILIFAEQDIEKDALEKFKLAVQKRITERVPVQYLIGYAGFYGLKFAVNKNVLIPRNDTEILVENAIEKIKQRNYKNIADVGVGSGNISISILKNTENTHIVATDISAEAIKIARENSIHHGVIDRIEFRQTNILEGLQGNLEAVVSNPPYISRDNIKMLDVEVSGYEPEEALYSSADNVNENYYRLSDQAFNLLKPGGMLAVEIDYKESESITSLFLKDGWINSELFYDLNKLPRVIIVYRP